MPFFHPRYPHRLRRVPRFATFLIALGTVIIGGVCVASSQTAARAQDTASSDKGLNFGATAGNQNQNQNRVALVIGNAYNGSNSLANTLNDARDMAATLRSLGFEVTLLQDADKRQMEEAIRAFGTKLDATKGVGLFYFSGHGVQVDGHNYLVPMGFAATKATEVPYEAVDAGRVLAQMEGVGNPLNIVILDACRNNPFRGTTRGLNNQGLARMDAPAGTLIAYATAPGQTASDNPEGRNGLYTQELLKQIRTPGLPLMRVFMNTRIAVKGASKAAQVPWEESSLESDFYFASPTAPVVPVVPVETSVVDTVARLTVSAVNAPGATFVVDDVPVSAGSTYSLDLGLDRTRVVEVGVKAAGFLPRVQRVTLRRGVTIPLSVTLEKASVPEPAPAVVGNSETAAVPPPVHNQPGTKINPKDGAEMVYIPAGPFLMGDDDQKYNPRHTVTLSGYYIYRNLVTVAMYRRYCAATGKSMPSAPSWGWKDDHPIVNVSWEDAKAYCDWAGVSLPTEAQWEKAARGTAGKKYPWGDEFDNSRLWCSVSEKRSGTAAAGSFPSGASPYGVLDMAGNVWQWCADWYDEDYIKSSSSSNPSGPGSGTSRALRGGSWNSGAGDFRSSYRGRYVPTNRDDIDGFRCASPGP